jgi:hypothetical protein
MTLWERTLVGIKSTVVRNGRLAQISKSRDKNWVRGKMFVSPVTKPDVREGDFDFTSPAWEADIAV